MSELLWSPREDWRETSELGRLLDRLSADHGLEFGSYEELRQWSIADLPTFWAAIWDHFGIVASTPYERVLADEGMPGARWFEGARLNYAEHALRHAGGPALIARSQTRPGDVELSFDELREQVGRARSGLQRLGVGRGDRVAAYLPNVPETVVAFLATASLGAVWSSCAPEFGVRGVIDRFAQIEPKVLLAADGYAYGSKRVDRVAAVEEVRAGLPGLRHTVMLQVLEPERAVPPDALTWRDLMAEPGEPAFEQVPFDHPLYILYSSGTTGLPKAIVHGHGAMVIEHCKALGVHHDVRPGDRFLWFTTTGWMMWNFTVSALLVGATAVLYDGDPGGSEFWRLAADVRATHAGSGAALLVAGMEGGLRPGRQFDLSCVRSVGSTGSPLSAEASRWCYEHVSRDQQLLSVSGGTDIGSGLVGGAPNVPVWAGEISCRYLGCRVEAWDATGQPVTGGPGELVVAAPMPSMPVGFWNDPDGARYRDAYFATYPGVWRHGDWIEFTSRGSCRILGRSDATLNRGGVRIGSAELYRVVERHPAVADSLAVHLHGDAGELVLLVVAADGAQVDDEVRRELTAAIRTELSPRHVPDRVEVVDDLPRTLNGKKCEVPVKRLLQGEPRDVVVNPAALANPEALEALEALRQGVA